MDPISVAASVATVIAVIGKSITTINGLRIQCKDVEFKLELLIGHLEIVQTALNQVRLLVTDCLSLQSQHQQLVEGLHRSLGFCQLLVQHIDNEITKIRAPGCELGLEKRVRLVLEDKAIESYLVRLDHQVSAINLCLSAFHCRTPQEQGRLLNTEISRSIFQRVKDDTTSLIAIDESSSTTRGRPLSMISTRSQLSKVFSFDEILLRHKVYQRSFRYMIRRASEPTSTEEVPQVPRSISPTSMSALEMRDSCERSARLDSMLKADAQKKRSEMRILSLGHKRSVVAKQLRSELGPLFQDDEIHSYRRLIVESLLQALVDIIDTVETRYAGFNTKHARQCSKIIREVCACGVSDVDISDNVSTAARALWRNYLVQREFQQNVQGDCVTAYYLSSTDRILNPDYKPTLTDVIRAPDRLHHIRETKLAIEDLNVSLIEVPHGTLGRIIHQFDVVDGCIFSLDLASYDRYNDDTKGHNMLEQGLRLFRGICKVLNTKTIFLVCVNFKAFQDKLKTSPFSIHFPNYKRSNEANAAADYILRRCKGVIATDQNFYHHRADFDDDVSTINFFKTKAGALPSTTYLLRALGL